MTIIVNGNASEIMFYPFKEPFKTSKKLYAQRL